MTMAKLSTAVAHALALRQLPDLAPCEQVNHTLAQLVNAVVDPASEHEAFEANTTKEIQQIAAEAEGEMELKWSQRIAAADLPQQETEHFIYWDNYVKLTAHEVELLKRSQTQQVNTQTGFPDQKSDLPLESDKVPILTKRYETDRTVRKGGFFVCTPEG